MNALEKDRNRYIDLVIESREWGALAHSEIEQTYINFIALKKTWTQKRERENRAKGEQNNAILSINQDIVRRITLTITIVR